MDSVTRFWTLFRVKTLIFDFANNSQKSSVVIKYCIVAKMKTIHETDFSLFLSGQVRVF